MLTNKVYQCIAHWSKNVYSYFLIIYDNKYLISHLAKHTNQFCWHHNKQKSNHCIFWGLRCKKYICGRNTKQMALASLFAFLRKHMHTKNVFRWNELSNCMYDILIMVEWSWLMLNAVYYIECIRCNWTTSLILSSLGNKPIDSNKCI